MTSPAPNSPCALVVDDNLLIRMSAADILEEAGFRVLEADHGDDAYELLKTRHSDVTLLFTDVQMPGTLDGFALARKVAMLWPHISLVVASGHVRPDPGIMPDKAKFIAKPFSVEVIHTHLQELLPEKEKPKPLQQAAKRNRND
ncbi:MAG: response regulator [Janthinobacterium lividum]